MSDETKQRTGLDRLLDLWFSLGSAAAGIDIGLFCLDHHWRTAASAAFAIAGWVIACAAIETKKGNL